MANQLPKDVGENVERNYETHLASLGLDLSDSDDDLICYETMTESDEEEDALCNEAMDNFERQRAFQSSLIQQSGGAMPLFSRHLGHHLKRSSQSIFSNRVDANR